jgi:hypothetical protein
MKYVGDKISKIEVFCHEFSFLVLPKIFAGENIQRQRRAS